MNTKNKKGDPPFSVFLFGFTIKITITAYLLGMKFIFPDVWAVQTANISWKLLIVFLIGNLTTACAEFFFHRYMLHRPFPFLERLHRQHTLHHDLTNVKLINVCDVNGRVFNRYPILGDPQHEASYFPWYSLAIFIFASLPIVIPVQMFLPDWPIMLGSGLAVMWAVTLYEILHMIEHLSFEKFWLPKIQHPRYGEFWTKVYCFHLRHHANIEANEAISGFLLGFPLFDFVFNTYAPWPRAFLHNEVIDKEIFIASAPRPCAFIRWLDKFSVKLQRKAD